MARGGPLAELDAAIEAAKSAKLGEPPERAAPGPPVEPPVEPAGLDPMSELDDAIEAASHQPLAGSAGAGPADIGQPREVFRGEGGFRRPVLSDEETAAMEPRWEREERATRTMGTLTGEAYDLGIHEDHPEVARAIAKSQELFPEDTGVPPEIEMPPEEPHFVRTLMQSTMALGYELGDVVGGRPEHRWDEPAGQMMKPGENPYLSRDVMERIWKDPTYHRGLGSGLQAIWEASEAALQEQAGRIPGTRNTALDDIFGLITTDERMGAAKRVAELKGIPYEQALDEAMRLPSSNPDQPPPDWLWIRQEEAYREQKAKLEAPGGLNPLVMAEIGVQMAEAGNIKNPADVYKLNKEALIEWSAEGRRGDAGVLINGIISGIFYSPTSWIRAPATAASKAKALLQLEALGARFARKSGRFGTKAGQRAFGESIKQVAEQEFKRGGGEFHGAMIGIKNRLREIDPALARMFDDEAFSIGREGWRLSFLPGDVVEMVFGLPSAAIRGTGTVLRAPARAMDILAPRGSAEAARYTMGRFGPRLRVVRGATGPLEEAGNAVHAVGRAVGFPARRMSELRKTAAKRLGIPLEIPSRLTALRRSRPAEKAGEILTGTPWGIMFSKARPIISTVGEDFPKGMDAAWEEGQTTWDVYARRMHWHQMRLLEEDNFKSAPLALGLKQLRMVGAEASTISQTERAGTRWLDWIKRSYGKKHRTWIDKDTGEIVEHLKQKKFIDDERGFVTALMEWVHNRSLELVQKGLLEVPTRAGDLLVEIERRAKLLDKAERMAKAADEAAMRGSDRAQELKALSEHLRAQVTDMSARAGQLNAAVAKIDRDLAANQDLLKLIGEHGLDPQPHRFAAHPGEDIVSVAIPKSAKNKRFAEKLIPEGWVSIPRPKHARTGRHYYNIMSGAVDLPADTRDALLRAKSVAQRELASISTRMDALAGKPGNLALKAETVEEKTVAMLAERVAAAERMARQGDAPTRAATETFANLEREIVHAVRRAYAQTLETVRNNDTIPLEVEWSDRLAGVSMQLGVALEDTYKSGLRHLADDLADWREIHKHLDERMAALYKFASDRFNQIHASLESVLGKGSVARLEGYVHHHIKNRDRILLEYPNKRFVSERSIKALKHRKVLTLRELKVENYDPVEDIITALEAAESAAVQMKWSHEFVDKTLTNRAWARKVGDHPLKGGEVANYTHPLTGELYVVDKEIAQSMTRLIEGAVNPNRLEGFGWFIDKYLRNTWKAYATYSRPSFHFRNAYSNVWLMYAGGFDPQLRPEQFERAFRIGTIRKLEEISGGVQEARRTLRGKRRVRPGESPLGRAWEKTKTVGEAAAHKKRQVTDAMEDRWIGQVQEWANETYKAANGKTYTGGELYEAATSRGVVNKRWQAADVDDDAGSTLERSRRWDPAVGAFKTMPFSQDSYLLRVGSETGMFVENHARMTLFIDRVLHHGDTLDSAAITVKRHLFDYKDLTEADKWMKKGIPFWTWARKASEHEIWNLLARPNRYSTVAKLKRGVEEKARAKFSQEEEASRALKVGSDWMRRRHGWDTWFASPQGYPLVWDPNMPWQEFQRFTFISEMLDGRPLDALDTVIRGVFSQAFPMWKMPASVMLKQKLPEGRKMYPEVRASFLTGWALDHIPGVGAGKGPHKGAVRYGRHKDSGEIHPLYNETWVMMLETSLPHVAWFSRMFDDPKSDPVRQSQAWARGGREKTGVSVYPLPPVQAKTQAASEISRKVQPYVRTAKQYERVSPQDLAAAIRRNKLTR